MKMNEKEMNKIKHRLYVSIVHVIYSKFTSNIFLSFKLTALGAQLKYAPSIG